MLFTQLSLFWIKEGGCSVQNMFGVVDCGLAQIDVQADLL